MARSCGGKKGEEKEIKLHYLKNLQFTQGGHSGRKKRCTARSAKRKVDLRRWGPAPLRFPSLICAVLLKKDVRESFVLSKEGEKRKEGRDPLRTYRSLTELHKKREEKTLVHVLVVGGKGGFFPRRKKEGKGEGNSSSGFSFSFITRHPTTTISRDGGESK